MDRNWKDNMQLMATFTSEEVIWVETQQTDFGITVLDWSDGTNYIIKDSSESKTEEERNEDFNFLLDRKGNCSAQTRHHTQMYYCTSDEELKESVLFLLSNADSFSYKINPEDALNDDTVRWD